ncbi:hypothetical protein DL96DRAFT_1561267 [Flagelloscypha sp. PMI_526]|nr:hypothetical protein DL96DRAFT_1561267 [Flagelloscypha sp. PMI_526]
MSISVSTIWVLRQRKTETIRGGLSRVLDRLIVWTWETGLTTNFKWFDGTLCYIGWYLEKYVSRNISTAHQLSLRHFAQWEDKFEGARHFCFYYSKPEGKEVKRLLTAYKAEWKDMHEGAWCFFHYSKSQRTILQSWLCSRAWSRERKEANDGIETGFEARHFEVIIELPVTKLSSLVPAGMHQSKLKSEIV